MSSFDSSPPSPALALGRSSPNEQPLLPFTSTAPASIEYSGTHTSASAGSPLTLTSPSQLVSTKASARPPVLLSGKQDSNVDGIAAADEQTQRIELLALIARLRKLLMPTTERLLRLRGVLKALQEQLVVVTPGAAAVTPTSRISSGASISSVSMPETNPPLRLCVTGTSELAMEEVFHFIVHGDPPQTRCGARAGLAGSASGSRSPAFSSNADRGGRLSTPDTGLLVSPQASPPSSAPQRWSRHESGGSTAGMKVMESGAATGASASGLWQTGAIGLGGDGQEATTTSPSFRFPSTPPLAPTLMCATNLVVHDCPSPSGTSHPHSPPITDSLLPNQCSLPVVNLRIASSAHVGGMRMSCDNKAVPPHSLPTTPPPLPATVSKATVPTSKMSATGSGAAALCTGNSSEVVRLPGTGTADNLQHCTLSTHPQPLSVTLGGSHIATSPPPLPSAPANHNVRRVRSTTSLKSRTVGRSAANVVAKAAVSPSYESPMDVAREESHEDSRMPSMSLSSTLPDLPTTPPPPLPGFSQLTAVEVSGAPSFIPSPQPGTSPVSSPASPTHQSIGASRPRTGNGQGFARASPLPASDFPASLTPIMINSLHCTSSQCSEVSEQPHHYHRPLPGSSLPPITARFTTLPAPFFSRARTRQWDSGGRSFREDSVILSHASSFTPPTMRLVQRPRRRMAVLGQRQLRLSAWDLFHTDHASGLRQVALPTTTSAPGVTSPAVLQSSGEQGCQLAKNGPGSGVNSSGSRLSNSRCQEYLSPLYGIHTVSETPSQAPLGPHWLVSVNEDGVLRYEPLPSAAQPPPYMRFSPVTTTADFAFLCVPYEALVRGMGSEASYGGAASTSDLLGASAGGVGVSVSGDGADEVAAVLDVLFGLFSGTKRQHSQGQLHEPQLHNATTGAPSILVTVNKGGGGGGATFSSSPVLSGSSATRDSKVPLPLPMLCTGNDGGQRTRQEKRQGTGSITSHQHETTTSVADTAGGGSRQDEAAPREGNSRDASAPRTRVSTVTTPTTANFMSSASTQQLSAGSLDTEASLLSHRLATVPGLSTFSTDEWLLPLRQALVDRTIFLLVKSSNEEASTPSQRRANPSISADHSDVAMDEGVVQRFLSFAKAHYGVTVQPCRVIIFSHRDATRARNVMLAVYGQWLRQMQRQQHRQSTSLQADAESLSQTLRTGGTSEDDVLSTAAAACDADVIASSTISPTPRSGAHQCSLSPLGSLYASPGMPVIAAPGWAQMPPGASLTSTSRLTLTSLNGVSEYRRGRSDGASRRHDIEDDKQELADPIYTFLTQKLSVPTLSMTLEQYKPLLGCRAAPRIYVQSGTSVATPGTVTATSSRFRVSFASGTGATISATGEGEQSVVDASRRFSAAVNPTTTIEGTTSTDVSDDSVSAEAATACRHAQEVMWRCSGAAGMNRALGYFQHAAVTHRVARAAFPVMAWTWQLSALLPAVIKDARSRYTRLRHSGRHTQHKLQGVLRSLQLHIAAGPAMGVAALETRLQEGFKDLMQRFLRDLRRLFVSLGSAVTAAASSSAAAPSSSSSPTIGRSAHEHWQPQMPPLAPLDALLLYDSPGLREAHQRFARAAFRFHAFYLAGQFAFTANIPRWSSLTSRTETHESTPSRQPRPISVYEQRYAALREAMSLAQGQLKTPPRICKDLTAKSLPGESCTRSGTPAFAPSLSPTRANPSATATSTRFVLHPPSPEGAAPAPVTATVEAEEAPMPKVNFGPDLRHRCTSHITSTAGFAASPKGKSAPPHLRSHSESFATPLSVSVGGGSHEQPLRHLLSSSSFTSAARKAAAVAVDSRSISAVPNTASSGKGSGCGSSGKGLEKWRIYSEKAADERADGGGTPHLSRAELQQCRLAIERQLITHVSQINTEILNFLLAACVAAVPHLQRHCVGAELERVRDSQAEIVSTLTTSVRDRKDAAIAMSNLYAYLEQWSADMSCLLSVVRSRAYLEKFITQLRAVLCEDEIRALAVFRCGCDDRKKSEDAGCRTLPAAGTPLSSPSAATVTHYGISATATRVPLLGGAAMTSGRHDSKNTTPKGSAGPHAATSPTPSGAPRTFASKSLAAEVGHRSARMLCYYTSLICQQHDPSLSSDFFETGTGADSNRSAVLGEVLASPSPSRSLRSLQGGTSMLTSPCRSSRVKGGGGGRAALGLSVSLSSMSAVWSREEERFPVEGGARCPHLYDFGNAATSMSAFFAAPMRPPMAAVSAELLAVLRATTQEKRLPPPQRTSASQTLASSQAETAATGGETSHLVTPGSGRALAARCESKQAPNPADGTALDELVAPVNTNAAAAAAHAPVNGGSGAWQKQLAQWRSALTEVERPADDASAAPLLWIILDAWDETLLRMPYGLLLELDTATYADSLNRMSGELMSSQQKWKSRCDDTLARIERQLKALREDLGRLCDDTGEARVDYLQELRAVFDAASAFVASRDDASHECLFALQPGGGAAPAGLVVENAGEGKVWMG